MGIMKNNVYAFQRNNSFLVFTTSREWLVRSIQKCPSDIEGGSVRKILEFHDVFLATWGYRKLIYVTCDIESSSDISFYIECQED